MTQEVEQYFRQRYRAARLDIPEDQIPDFDSKEHVDNWIGLVTRIRDAKRAKETANGH